MSASPRPHRCPPRSSSPPSAVRSPGRRDAAGGDGRATSSCATSRSRCGRRGPRDPRAPAAAASRRCCASPPGWTRPRRGAVRIDGTRSPASTPAAPSPSRSPGCCRGGPCRERRPGPAARDAGPRARDRVARPARPRRPHRLRRSPPPGGLRRHGPAHLAGPRARPQPGRAPARRAVRGARRPDPAQMQDLLLDVHAAAPTTVLLVTHDVDEALQLADRVILLGHGAGHEGATDPPGAHRARRAPARPRVGGARRAAGRPAGRPRRRPPRPSH